MYVNIITDIFIIGYETYETFSPMYHLDSNINDCYLMESATKNKK